MARLGKQLSILMRARWLLINLDIDRTSERACESASGIDCLVCVARREWKQFDGRGKVMSPKARGPAPPTIRLEAAHLVFRLVWPPQPNDRSGYYCPSSLGE